MIKGFLDKATKMKLLLDEEIDVVKKLDDKWVVFTNKNKFFFDKIVSTLPLQELFSRLDFEHPEDIKNRLSQLKYNSIITILLNVDKDNISNNFSLNFPNKDIIFHRLSKLNFLGENYTKGNTSTMLIEVTYRKGDEISKMSDDDLINRVMGDLKVSSIINQDIQSNFFEIRKTEYAYVIYDLLHRENVDIIKEYLNGLGIILLGRFSEFEYLNMDRIIINSIKLAQKMESGE